MAEEPIRAAFETAYRALYGPPPVRFRSGMETAVADYRNPFLWFDRHPVHTDHPPHYYYTDIQDKYVLFRAGYNARGAECDPAS